MTKTSIDEPTLGRIMDYCGIENHDVLAKYVKRLGVEHEDNAA